MYDLSCGAYCETDRYLLVAKVRESLAISKQTAQNFDVDRFNLGKLHELEDSKKYQNAITNRCAGLENLIDGEDINCAWENIEENIKTSAKYRVSLHELKQHAARFVEECLGVLDQICTLTCCDYSFENKIM
jgi:translation initiation factor IF-3